MKRQCELVVLDQPEFLRFGFVASVVVRQVQQLLVCSLYVWDISFVTFSEVRLTMTW